MISPSKQLIVVTPVYEDLSCTPGTPSSSQLVAGPFYYSF